MKTIPLTQGKVAVVDEEDYDRVMTKAWHARLNPKSNTWYARSNETLSDGKRITILMHRFILQLSTIDQDVDHRDLNGLNNQRCNLRIATRSQNIANRPCRPDSKSRFKGVRFDERKGGRWYAHITIKRKQKHLGTFRNEIDAAMAYDVAAKTHYGEFARINFQ